MTTVLTPLTPLTSEISYVRWYGFYRPEGKVPPVSEGLQREILRAVSEPVFKPEQVPGLINLFAQAFPSFIAVQRGVEKEGTTFVVTRDGLPIGMEEPTTPVFSVPRGDEPLGNLASWITILGGMAVLPEGLTRFSYAAQDSKRSREKFLKAYFWNMAIAKSFLFQVAFEVSSVGMSFPVPSRTLGLLSETDIALFEILRRDGLAGVMRMLPNITTPAVMEKIEGKGSCTVEQVAMAMVPARSSGPIEVPSRDERPPLTRTFLDDSADLHLSWGRGLLGRSPEGKRFPARRRSEVTAQMVQPFRGLEDLPVVTSLFRELAPGLAEILLPPLEREEIPVRVVNDPSANPTDLTLPIPRLFDLPTDPSELVIQRGALWHQVLANLVGDLARARVPDPIYRFAKLPPPSGDTTDPWATIAFLNFRFRARGAWSVSAQLELTRQAASRGIDIWVVEHYRRMKTLLESHGLALLIERYGGLLGDDYEQSMRLHHWYAAAFITAGGLPVIARLHAGETVAPEELRAVSERLLEVLSRPLEGAPVTRLAIGLADLGMDVGLDPQDSFPMTRGELREEAAALIARADPEVVPRRKRAQTAPPRNHSGELKRIREAEKERRRGEWERVRKEERVAAEKRRQEAGRAAREEKEREAGAERERLRKERRALGAQAAQTERRLRESTRSVLLHRRDELGGLIRRLEDLVLDLAERGLLSADTFKAESVTLSLAEETRTIQLRPPLEAAAGELQGEFDRKAGVPFSTPKATSGITERMIALCDQVRSSIGFVSRVVESFIKQPVP